MNILTHKTAISPPFIPDAFPSKNANRAYNQSVCFCARSNCNSIFPFTGKEKDPETGYSYFGARYLEHELMAGWLSVDPMADKYPSISPYAYCAWNPVRLVDPNGEKWRTAGDSTAANEMKSAVKSRMNDISNIIQDNKRKILEIAHDSKMKQNRKDRKTSKLNMETDDLSYQLELLSDFLEGIKEIEDDEDIKYTFNPTGNSLQVNTFVEVDGVITINYQDHPMIGFANMLHETTHAIQHYKGQLTTKTIIECEKKAYSTQYAFSPESFRYIDNYLLPSSHISEEWVRGVSVVVNGIRKYPYKDK